MSTLRGLGNGLRRVAACAAWEMIVSAGRIDAARADAEHRALVSRIDKAVKAGALHSGNGARKKAAAARLRARI